MRTSMQHAASRRRREARRRSFLDGHAFNVGRLDAWLYNADNPYPKDSANWHAWADGYQAGSAERDQPFAKVEA